MSKNNFISKNYFEIVSIHSFICNLKTIFYKDSIIIKQIKIYNIYNYEVFLDK